MIEFPITLVFWHWWIAGVVLLGLEMVIPGTFFLWMGAAAGVTGALLLIFPDPSWQIQFLIFAVLSVVSIFGWRSWRKKHPPAVTDHPHLNQRTEQYVGRIITLDQTLENGRGRMLIDGTMNLFHAYPKGSNGHNLVEGRKIRAECDEEITRLQTEEDSLERQMRSMTEETFSAGFLKGKAAWAAAAGLPAGRGYRRARAHRRKWSRVTTAPCSRPCGPARCASNPSSTRRQRRPRQRVTPKCTTGPRPHALGWRAALPRRWSWRARVHNCRCRRSRMRAAQRVLAWSWQPTWRLRRGQTFKKGSHAL